MLSKYLYIVHSILNERSLAPLLLQEESLFGGWNETLSRREQGILYLHQFGSNQDHSKFKVVINGVIQ